MCVRLSREWQQSCKHVYPVIKAHKLQFSEKIWEKNQNIWSIKSTEEDRLMRKRAPIPDVGWCSTLGPNPFWSCHFNYLFVSNFGQNMYTLALYFRDPGKFFMFFSKVFRLAQAKKNFGEKHGKYNRTRKFDATNSALLEI